MILLALMLATTRKVVVTKSEVRHNVERGVNVYRTRPVKEDPEEHAEHNHSRLIEVEPDKVETITEEVVRKVQEGRCDAAGRLADASGDVMNREIVRIACNRKVR